MRKIKIFTTVGKAGEIETSATTFGELKPILADRNISIAGMKLTVGETLNELDLDGAVLPDTDFRIFLTPAKTKSGYSDKQEIKKALMGVREKLERIEDLLSDMNCTLDNIEDNTDSMSFDAPQKPKETMSYEDRESIEMAKRLANSGSVDPWS